MNNIHNKSLSFFKLVRITSKDNKSFIEFQGRFASLFSKLSVPPAQEYHQEVFYGSQGLFPCISISF